MFLSLPDIASSIHLNLETCTHVLRTEHVSGAGSGAGRKASERERSGERDFRKKRGAGAERGAGDRGTGTERI
jgi:hypothetical protein